jgi:hypothetical protein
MTKTLNRSIATKGELPQVRVSWTKQELINLANLFSRRPAEPTPDLIRAIREDA